MNTGKLPILPLPLSILVLLTALLAACGDRSAEPSPEQPAAQSATQAAAQSGSPDAAIAADQTQAEAVAKSEVVARAGAPLFAGMGDHQHPVTVSDP